MSITVGDIVADPALRTTVQSGDGGLDRVVTWAHASELPAPWEWIDEGILLMTSGGALPPGPAEQVEFVERLLGAGIAALAIGQHVTAPELSREMLAASDQLGFPILFTAPDVPFVRLARAVASANEREERQRIVRTARLYEHVRTARLGRKSAAQLFADLGDQLGCSFTVCENEHGDVLVSGEVPLPDELRVELVDALAARDGLAPAVLRLGDPDERVLAVPVPCRRPASLVAAPRRRAPELTLLQHVATIAALEVEELEAERERRRRRGATLFAQLVDGHAPGALGDDPLEGHDFERHAEVLVAACSPSGPWHGRGELHHRLAHRSIPNLLLRRDALLFALVPAEPDAVAALLDVVGEYDDCAVGLSEPFRDAGEAAEAVREARWAVEASRARDGAVTRYGESTALLLPRTHGEAQSLVDEVLGALLEHDSANAMSLVASLRVFLECNRSWQRAAEQLGVHKQTLVYRIRRVEELTGRKLADTGDIAELWFALRALAMIRSAGRAASAETGRAAGA